MTLISPDLSLTRLMAQMLTDNHPEPPATTELSEDPSVTDFLVQGMELQNLQ